MNSAKNLLGKDAIIRSFKRNNVDTIFGYSGGAILPVFDSLSNSGIKYFMNRHEQSSGHCAEGYAKVSGKPGIVTTTSGPGVTNLITPLQDSYSDGVPIIVFTGQVPTHAIGTDAFQECPAIELTRPCTKWNYQLKDADEIEYIIDKAFHIATTGRPGPVHIDLPKDIMNNKVLKESREFGPLEEKKEMDAHNLIKMEVLCNLIEKSERPLIIAGHGCVNYDKQVTFMAHKCNIPVTTTLHGLGIFDEYSSKSLHMLGMHGSAYANYAVQEADLILSLGSRFDDRIIGTKDGFAPEARKAEREGRGGIFQVEIEPYQIGKSIVPTETFIGDCGEFLNYVVDNTGYMSRKKWFDRISKLKEMYPFNYKKSNNHIKTQQVIEKISEKTSMLQNTLISTGVGNHQMMTAQFYRWTSPKQMLSSGSLGTMGVGVPFAIGAKLACPEKMVICIDGDGSFNMTMNELATIAEYNIPVKIAIMNDSRQQMVYVWQELFFNSNFISTTNHNPDYNMLAESFGIKSIRCDNPYDLDQAVTEFIKYDGPILGNFIVEPDKCLPLVAPGKNLDEMILTDDEDILLTGEAPN
jgi:acetolactate synthase I/II/III large subunit